MGLGDVMDCKPGVDPEHWQQWVSNLTDLTKQKLVHASFVGIEFARNVELQTDLFLMTQENVAHFLSTRWNTDEILQLYQKPTCVINTGHHDALIPNITKEA